MKTKPHAGNGTWEHLVLHLEEKLNAKEKFMNLDELEKLSHSPGDIVLCIVQEWARREAVTVSHFCRVSQNLGNERVYSILSSMAQTDSLSSSLNTCVELQSLKNSSSIKI